MDCVEEATQNWILRGVSLLVEIYLRATASIISQEHVGKLPTKQLSDAPKDKLYLVRIIFFFYGLSSMLPMSFFMIANDYWMYKFRNTTYDNWDPHHRTPLQIYYGSILSIVKAVPVMLVSLLAAKFIHKLHLRPRLIYSTFITCSVFIALTVFVVIDTDDFADVVFRMSQTRLLARFPIIYMKFDMYGSGCSSLLSIFLQIISLAIGKDPISRALIFFICGSAVILTSLLLALAKKYFVPVVTFLMPDIAGLVGKFFAKPIMTRKNAKWFILMTFVQRLIFTPLYFFCNAPTATERHIPILLPHDWQYITIVITDATSMSILGGICMLSMSRLTEGEKQKTEDGFIVISTLMGVFIGILSPLGTLCVKTSLLSQEHAGKLPTKTSLDVPKDTFHLVKILFFFYGLNSMLPISFFMVANDYWMYKFRNTTYDNWDPYHRTPLQIYYHSVLGIVKAVPVMIVSLLAAKYIHKIHLRPRLLYSTFVACVMFVSLTLFVFIDTDDWQFIFLIIIAIIMTVLSVAGVIFRLSHTRLLARFPILYMKFDMYGSGCSSLFSIFLQIISLAIGNDPISRASIFFVCGTAVVILTFILALASEHLSFYRFKELLRSGFCIWPCIVQFLIIIGAMLGTASVTNLIVSEYYGNGNSWNEKYFVPVVTFLIPTLADFFGKYTAKPLMTRKNAKWFVLATVLEALTFSPLYFFCNAPTATKRQIPILLPHDWQYVTILTLDSTFSSVLAGICMLSVSRLTGGDKQKTEDGLLVMSTLIYIFVGILSPLGPLTVKLL
nr:unnamed protein product [Callosobruchus chinensis]